MAAKSPAIAVGTPAPLSMVNDDAIAAEIRIVQSVQAQGSMPALLAGLVSCVVVVFYLDWTVALSSNAVYFLAIVAIMIVPALRSYFRLRRLPRPKTVSKRRIRVLEIYTSVLGLVWAMAIFLVMRELRPVDGALIIALTFSLSFGSVALNPGLPRAAAVFSGAVLTAVFAGAYLNDIVEPDLLVVMVFSFSLVLSRTVWQNWRDVTATVRLSLEKLQAEAETHRRETEAMRSMLGAIPFPLVLIRENGALEASETAARQFGIPAGELDGVSIGDFFVNPDDQDKMAELQAQQGRLVEYEVQFKNAHGAPFWALLSSLPLKYEGEDCWLNAVYVIDDRKRAEADLLEAKQRAESTSQTLEAVSEQLAKYISPQLYQSIFSGEQRVAIESKRKKLTIFFSDLAGFTEITDQLESEELTALLNLYLTEMSKIALAHGAYFDKFIGDAMMFYFGDPETKGVKEDASACLRMAIAMQRRLAELEVGWREQGLIDQPFEIRIGINTGYCTVGNFGSEDRMDYTIIGGEVNLAARLEALADAGGILIANETYSLVKDWLFAEEREAITMKGFAKPVKTFRVVGIHDELAAEGRIIRHEEDGLTLTIDRDGMSGADKTDAIQALEEALAQLRD